MAKRKKTKTSKRLTKSQAKEKFEFMVSSYIEVFKKADRALIPQGHPVVKGRPWDKRRALEAAWFFMNAAVALYGRKPKDAIEYYYIARGIAISQGEVPDDVFISESAFLYKPKKPS